MKKSEKAIWNKLKNQYADNEEVLDVLCTGENAAEKQIPQKSYEDKSDERTLHKCPACKYIFVTEYPDGALCGGRKSKHCPECGQAMQW